VDVVGEVLPRPRDALHLGLAAELALGAHFAGDSGDLVGEGRELVDHDVDGVLQLEDLALDVDGDLLGQVALGHGGRDLGDVPDLAGEVGRQEVDVVGEVLPGAGHALDARLTAELAFGAHLAGDSGDLVGERRQRVGHAVDGLGQGGDLALGLDGDLLELGGASRCEGRQSGAMFRTWLARLEARKLTLSVRSFHVPATPSTWAWPPRIPSVPTSRATRVTSSAKARRVSVMPLMVSARAATSPLASTVIFW